MNHLLPQVSPIWVPILITSTLLIMAIVWDVVETSVTLCWKIVWLWIFFIWIVYLIWTSLTLAASISELTP